MYELEFNAKALTHIRRIKKSGNKVVMTKLKKLLDEIERHPTTGTGKPKQLSGDKSGLWSRRITDKHRLIYKVYEYKIVVLIVSVLGHYDES